jgi:hypothetical protein
MNPEPVMTVTKKIDGHPAEFRVYQRDPEAYYCLFDFLDIEHCSGASEGDLESAEAALFAGEGSAAYKLTEWEHLFPGSTQTQR